MISGAPRARARVERGHLGTGEIGYKSEGGEMKYVLVKGEDPNCNDCKKLTGPTVERRWEERAVPCYFQIENSVVNGRRLIRLFMNAEDSTEAKLIALLRRFSEAYSEPLAINVYTDIKQAYDFALSITGERILPSMREYFVAVLFRESGNEVIRYRRPQRKIATVVVNGLDIFPKLNEQLRH